MAGASIPREHLDHAISTLRQDQSPSGDSISGQFFDKEGWLEGLPRSAQNMVCAVQRVGEHPDRPLHLHSRAAESFASWKDSGSREALETAIAFSAIAVHYTRPDDAQRPQRLTAFAFACQVKWEQTKDIDDLDVTVHFFRRAVIAAEPSSPSLGAYTTNLAYILHKRWDRTKRSEDRQEAKSNFLRAIGLASNHPLLPQVLSNYGEFLRLTAVASNIFLDDALEEAVNYQALAIAVLVPSLPIPYAMIWRNAAIANHSLFKKTCLEENSAKAIEFYQTSIKLADDNQNTWRSELAQHYQDRFNVRSRMQDLEKSLSIYELILERNSKDFTATIGKADSLRMIADRTSDAKSSIALLEEACQFANDSQKLVDENNDSRGWAYFRTSAIYLCRFESDGRREYLDKAVDSAVKSLTYTKHDAFWDFGRWCAEVCRQRHVQDGSVKDLDQAFTAIYAAIERLDEWDVEHLADCTWVLGKCFTSQYEQSKNIEDLDATLKWLTASCLPGPSRAHTLALTQNDLANALCTKFQHTSSPDMLEQAIKNYALSIKNLSSAGLNSKHGDFAMLQNGLGQAMLQRYQYWNSREDLASAIENFSKSFKSTDRRNARSAGRACNLSYALQLMYSIDESMHSLREAQNCLNIALESPVEHGEKLLQLLNCHMGNMYNRSYSGTNELADLDRAISYYTIVKNLPNADHRIRADVTMNIGVALGKKARRSKQRYDFLQSISSFDEAEELESGNNPRILVTKLNRAEVLLSVYDILGNHENGEKALKEFTEVTTASDARFDVRLRAVDAASMLEARLHHDYVKAYAHIAKAIQWLPQVVALFSNRSEQLRYVRKYHYLPSSATALAVQAGVTADEILSLLERARSFIWDRFLLSESPVENLKEAHPELARRFEALRSALVSPAAININNPVTEAISTKDQLRLERHTKANEYSELIKLIQEKSRFEQFPLPSEAEARLELLSHESAVHINFSQYRCDAIIRSFESTRTLPLPAVKMEDVMKYAIVLHEVQLNIGRDPETSSTEFDEVMRWLWLTTAAPILEDVEQLAPLDSDEDSNQRRIYWVTSSWISIFPIHAAGDWSASRAPEARQSVHERAISSYIPSMRVLQSLRRRQSSHNRNPAREKALLLGMPSTPGMDPNSSDLPAASEEIATIEHLLTSNNIATKTSLAPTLNDITTHLPSATLAHLACHGLADPKDPSKSAIRLTDWQTHPLDVRALLKLRLKHCQLVFLSACETAANKDVLLRDEGLHVAGAVLMAGVVGVVAGMWKVQDWAAGELVGRFYGRLFGVEDEDGDMDRDGDGGGGKGLGKRDFEGTAGALHEAVGALRRKGCRPVIWGAFVHLGP